jgi:hypothetical protein
VSCLPEHLSIRPHTLILCDAAGNRRSRVSPSDDRLYYGGVWCLLRRLSNPVFSQNNSLPRSETIVRPRDALLPPCVPSLPRNESTCPETWSNCYGVGLRLHDATVIDDDGNGLWFVVQPTLLLLLKSL